MRDRELVVTGYSHGRTLYAYYEAEKLTEISVGVSDRDTLRIGDIYIGKVQNVVKNIHAAFVDVGGRQVGYYPMDEHPTEIYRDIFHRDKLASGDEILVQVSRENQKTKAFSLTSHIHYNGEHMIFIANGKSLGISRKITSAGERRRLKEMFAKWKEKYDTPNDGVIFRTCSEKCPDEILEEEYARLLVYHKNIMSTYRSRTCFSRLMRGPSQAEQYIRNFPFTGSSRIVTDLPDVYKELKLLEGNILPEGILDYYTDDYPLIKLKSLETQLERALKKEVHLKSGASLIIEPMETLTAIDVNTSKYIKKKDDNEETFFQINMEAAAEILRQIRLRNLSGMIIIDFINMKDPEHYTLLMDHMRKGSKDDPVQVNCIDITGLGLFELTRKKVRRPLFEQVRAYD